ncbi:hypothetical protein [Anaerobacillus alkalidiazotrophicus]|uniref:hypothetical protein n=1 Tax=Anaerobacillus alkalidiazotrophicus TaxID=472963 RepID=UPI0014716206|nr:hypothetical protein [Anaerobacillus alkalidiazotrophicus]
MIWNFMSVVTLLAQITGVYLIILSLWELRVGKNKKKYTLLMGTGLFLYLFLPIILY